MIRTVYNENIDRVTIVQSKITVYLNTPRHFYMFHFSQYVLLTFFVQMVTLHSE